MRLVQRVGITDVIQVRRMLWLQETQKKFVCSGMLSFVCIHAQPHRTSTL